jgi:hypothetical protein
MRVIEGWRKEVIKANREIERVVLAYDLGEPGHAFEEVLDLLARVVLRGAGQIPYAKKARTHTDAPPGGPADRFEEQSRAAIAVHATAS